MTTRGYKVLTLTDEGLQSPFARKKYPVLGDWTKSYVKTVMCHKGWHLWNNRAAADSHFKNEVAKGKTVLMFSATGKDRGSKWGNKSVYSTIRLVKLLRVQIGTKQ